MSQKSCYLYGVAPADGPRSFGPVGLGGADTYTVCDGAIAIVASKMNRVEFAAQAPEKTLASLAQHQRVLEQVMVHLPVIPLKFGTYADDDRQIVEIIHRGRKEFAGALEEYAGKVEVDIAAFWTDMNCVLADVAQDKSVTAMKSRITEGSASIEQRVAMGKLVKKLLDERREQVAAHIAAELRTQWPGIVVNPAKDDSMVFNAAVLTGSKEQGRFEGFINRLDRLFDDRLRFRCVGPLPPYSFATAEVRTVEAARIDAARRALALGERASLAEIKAAHRRALQQTHPDMNLRASSAGEFKDVSEAYNLLEEYAMNVQHSFGADQSPMVLVKVRSLNDLRGPGKHAGVRTRAASRDAVEIGAA